jgi:predicted dehydrogenase
MVKIGLMGCGTVADYGHLPAIKANRDLELVALFDPDRARLEAAGRKFGCEKLFTEAEAFMTSGIEAISVTSPAPCHFENVMLAAKLRKHVLCEKPLAMTDREGEQMVAAMEAAACRLFVGFTYRFSPVAQQVKELVSAGAIGVVRSARLVYIWDCHGKFATRDPGETRLNQRRHGRMVEGGPMVDCGVHQIDLARWWLSSDVVRFKGHGAWVDEYKAPDHVWVHMDHENGAHSMIESSFSYGHTARQQRPHYVFEVIGTGGVVRYDHDHKKFELRTRTEMKELAWHAEKNFEGMYEQFVQAVRTGEAGTLASGRDGIVATRIAREATEQAMAERLRAVSAS